MRCLVIFVVFFGVAGTSQSGELDISKLKMQVSQCGQRATTACQSAKQSLVRVALYVEELTSSPQAFGLKILHLQFEQEQTKQAIENYSLVSQGESLERLKKKLHKQKLEYQYRMSVIRLLESPK